MSWWREARFGMFIHWGLYALTAGFWKGRPVPGASEWIMRWAQIPANEYEQLAARFNPDRFDAQQWVELAKSAGMKYIVITAKHHDGFAMFRSACSSYNIVDAAPFGRDPLKELAEVCRKEGVKLGFYYSQYQDWHHPDAGGNDWDYPDASAKGFDRYMRDKALPQIRELLTNYGDVGLIWFDTPGALTEEQSREFAMKVRELQPACLLNSRAGYQFHDYESTNDNMIPASVFDTDWEVPATLNHVWGYREDDHHWKSAAELIRLLVNINSKGGNYLLNVGPRADGTIPEASVDILQEVGRWVRENGEAIYGTTPCPAFPFEMPWGYVTHKPGKLYFHFFHWKPGKNPIFGLRNRVLSAYLLSDKNVPIPFVQHPILDSQTMPRMQLILPEEGPDSIASVIVLEYEGELAIDKLVPSNAVGQ
jgi:alpha-L-fucosidase